MSSMPGKKVKLSAMQYENQDLVILNLFRKKCNKQKIYNTVCRAGICPVDYFFLYGKSDKNWQTNAVHLQIKKTAVFSRNKKAWPKKGHPPCPYEEFQRVHLQVDWQLKKRRGWRTLARREGSYLQLVMTESALWRCLLVVMEGEERERGQP